VGFAAALAAKLAQKGKQRLFCLPFFKAAGFTGKSLK